MNPDRSRSRSTTQSYGYPVCSKARATYHQSCPRIWTVVLAIRHVTVNCCHPYLSRNPLPASRDRWRNPTRHLSRAWLVGFGASAAVSSRFIIVMILGSALMRNFQTLDQAASTRRPALSRSRVQDDSDSTPDASMRREGEYVVRLGELRRAGNRAAPARPRTDPHAQAHAAQRRTQHDASGRHGRRFSRAGAAQRRRAGHPPDDHRRRQRLLLPESRSSRPPPPHALSCRGSASEEPRNCPSILRVSHRRGAFRAKRAASCFAFPANRRYK